MPRNCNFTSAGHPVAPFLMKCSLTFGRSAFEVMKELVFLHREGPEYLWARKLMIIAVFQGPIAKGTR